ncbi:FAD-binding protein, partial [Mycolicibacterium holsaticum]|uniref:FAD-binding protein n=1 Tax=Mycolicibacterium holsaticum TaxID=152142 RepID=UPI000A685B43
MADADVIVVGAGLAGLVAACEVVDRGRRVLIVDQENANNLGGQAYWSFGGLFFVDSPEQRRVGIRDSHELALQDWLGTAGFDRPEDHWPRQWAHAYVDFAAGEKRSWLRERGLQIFPLVGWAERGGYDARGHGNSVPRFHITWGTGPAIVDVFAPGFVIEDIGDDAPNEPPYLRHGAPGANTDVEQDVTGLADER